MRAPTHLKVQLAVVLVTTESCHTLDLVFVCGLKVLVVVGFAHIWVLLVTDMCLY